MKISVAMATYNGEEYLLDQINSIVKQLGPDDEIIICDDGSVDNTIKIIENLMYKEKRIYLFENKHKGVVKSFEDAIGWCKNDIIFLSDQDDIWETAKVKQIKNYFENTDKSLVLHNAINFFENQLDFNKELISNMHHGTYSNIYKSSYWGCCMAFKQELRKYILPFPEKLISHDQWIGLIAESRKESGFLNAKLIKHRIHTNNVSNKLSLKKKIQFRLNLLVRYLKYKLGLLQSSLKEVK
jgi:glycosyltransferase involved in cell wall biosynthesis